MKDELWEALKSEALRRVDLNTLRRRWREAHPDQLHEPRSDAVLLEALQRLAEDGRLRLPARNSFERFGDPPMPRFVTLVRDVVQAPRVDPSMIAWRPELGFWPSLTSAEIPVAAQINRWLCERQGRFITVPLRERSLEIFGDEKFLESRVRKAALFGGRLPIASIGAFVAPYPLPYRPGRGPGKPLLVVENHNTFWSLGEWNATAHRYSAVAYGAGNAFCSTGPGLAEAIRETGAEGVLYFGDIDPPGVRIPNSFNQVSDIRVAPELELYRWALRIGRPGPMQVCVPGDLRLLASWMPQLADDIKALWERGLRIAQESLGLELLLASTK